MLRLLQLILIAVALAFCLPVSAEDSLATLTVAELEDRLKGLEHNTTLPEEARIDIAGFYAQAIESTRRNSTLQQQIIALREKINKAPTQIDKLKKELGQAETAVDLNTLLPAEPTLTDIEELIFSLDADLSRANETYSKQRQSVASNEQGGNLRDSLSEKVSLLDQIESDLAASANADGLPELNTSRLAALNARANQRSAEIVRLKMQIENEALLANLVTSEGDLARARMTQIEPQLTILNDLAQKQRERQAGDLVSEAEEVRDNVADLPDAVQLLADDYVTYSIEHEKLIRLEAQAIEDARATQLERDSTQTTFESTRQRVAVAGPTSAIGRMLRKRLRDLPSTRDYSRESRQRSDEISRATDRQIDIDELRLDLSRLSESVDQVLLPLARKDIEAEELQTLRTNAMTLLDAQKTALNNLYRTYSGYISELTKLDTLQKQQVKVSSEFVAFIEETLLKIRSTTPLLPKDILQMSATMSWAMSPANWTTAAVDLVNGVNNRILVVANAIIIVLLLALFRRFSKRRLDELGQLTIKIRTDSFRHTLKALFYTFVIISAVPLLLATVGWAIGQSHSSSNFSLAISQGLILSSLVLLTTDFFRKACRIDGLTSRHFRWSDEVRAQIRKEFHWFFPTSFILSFIVAATAGVPQNEYVPSIGRPAFITLMVTLLLLTYRVYKKNGSLAEFMVDKRGDHWFTSARVIWYPLLLLIPVLLIGASLAGYHYSAVHLSWRLLVTHWFFIGIGLLLDLFLRWIYVEQRRLKYSDAVRRMEENENKTPGQDIPGSAFAAVDELEIDYKTLSEQARRLLTTSFLFATIVGVWYIWADLLPALDFLNTVQLPFSGVEVVDGIEKEVPITLGDIVIGLVVGFLTIFAARNLPGILEFTILQRLPLDSASRYAITTISQYVIMAVGIFSMFTLMGVDWSSIGWVVAALGVGLGFGLQEIFANFVSGLIILFEQPARVGDTVTVGDLTGTVNRIQIRATTIRDFDQKEIIVPNKSFITEKLINWTLTDPITRVVVPVGIAYGSDTRLAYDLIKTTAQHNELVMSDPPLQLFFLGFGDNALDFELRVFVRQLDDRLPVKHALHMDINDVLQENGIEIPFPQRDIHIRSTTPPSTEYPSS